MDFDQVIKIYTDICSFEQFIDEIKRKDG